MMLFFNKKNKAMPGETASVVAASASNAHKSAVAVCAGAALAVSVFLLPVLQCILSLIAIINPLVGFTLIMLITVIIKPLKWQGERLPELV